MHVIDISDLIRQELKTLQDARGSLRERAKEKANAKGDYDLRLSQAIVGLKNGKIINGVEYTQASGLEKVAKGLVWKEAIRLDLAETNYKSAITAIDVGQTAINALQSLLRVEQYVTKNND